MPCLGARCWLFITTVLKQQYPPFLSKGAIKAMWHFIKLYFGLAVGLAVFFALVLLAAGAYG
jgi:hypothetical protein